MQQTIEPETGSILNDRYLPDDLSIFDAIEIQGVREHTEHGEDHSYIEPDPENPQFYSVYLHCKEGGVDCIGDLGTYALALSWAGELSAIHNWHINDFTQNQGAVFTIQK